MRAWLAVVVMFGAATVASAHHSFAAHYFEEQSVTVEGEVAQFDLRAPHAVLFVTAPDAEGRVQRFAAEWSHPNRLARDGVTAETLKTGDRVVITGSPGRTASEHKVHLKRIRRPADGWEWRGGRRR